MKSLFPLISKSLFLIAINSCWLMGQELDEGKHLFILSGQSNMANLDPSISFTPAVEEAFGADNIIVVKDAMGAQPIRRWYKEWVDAEGNKPETAVGDLYDRLMRKVNDALGDEEIQTVSFFWMQGERDAREQHGEVYKASLLGVVKQLQEDLECEEINVVIGRLSDFDMENRRYQHWTLVRDEQVALANELPKGAWIDTDDLNDGKNRKGNDIANDLHMSVEGYKTMGSRFANAGIALINGVQEPDK